MVLRFELYKVGGIRDYLKVHIYGVETYGIFWVGVEIIHDCVNFGNHIGSIFGLFGVNFFEDRNDEWITSTTTVDGRTGDVLGSFDAVFVNAGSI